MLREDIAFRSDDALCRGWLYRTGEHGPSPCIILAHGFCGTRDMRLDAYAERFAAAGLHALVFDYRHFGISEGEPRQLLDIGKQLTDWAAAIAFARSLPAVDPARLVLWGTSFSGGHVLEAAVRDGRVAAVISQVPHLSGPATAGAAGSNSLRLAAAAARDLLRAARGRKPFYVPAFGAPGTLAAMTAPGAEQGAKALFPRGCPEPDTTVAARVFLPLTLYSPGRLAPKLDAPWLVQAALRDATTPVKPAIRAAKRAPRGELVTYDLDHFDVYVEPYFEQTVTDQLAFLRKHRLAK